MSHETKDRLKALLASLAFLALFLFAWHAFVVAQTGPAADMDPELAALLGPQARGQSALPTPLEVGTAIWGHLRDPFYDAGPNDKGIGIQLAWSILRVLIGFGLAALVAIPLGFVIGMSRVAERALNPYIQLLKPVSPVRTAFRVILPAAAPTILTGMRISIGIAWLVIVAAEMLVGGTGIGYFVWNEWNNLSITGVISAIFFIGLVGMVLDLALGQAARLVAYAE